MQYRILLVEDSPTDAELIQNMLFDHQFDVQAVDRLALALSHLEEQTFDLALLDINLPDSSGLQTFSKLYTAEPQLPIVVLTGLDDEKVAQKAVRLGAQDYLHKNTVTDTLLARAIHYAIERNQLQTQLQASEARYRELFENAQDIIYTQGMDGRITSVNREFERLLGYSCEEIIGKSPSSIAESLVIEQNGTAPLSWSNRRAELHSNGKTIAEFVVRNKHGELIPLEVTSRLIYRDSQVVGMQGIARDITERKEAVKALAKSERDFRLLAENSSDMISRHDPDGVFLYVSPACMKLLGYRPDELVGCSGYEFFHPDDLEAIQKSHETVLNHPDIYTVEYRMRKKNGDYTWFESSNHHIKDPETNEIVEIQVASRDISERKQAEAKIRAAQQFAQNTVDSLSANIAIVNECGDIIETNKAWDQYALAHGGQPENTGQGVNYFEVCRGVAGRADEIEAARAFAGGLRAVLDGESDDFSIEYEMGEDLWFRGHVTPLTGDGPRMAVVTHEDVSAQKRVEEDLEKRVKDRTADLDRVNRRISAILNNASDAILLVAGDCTIEITNPAFNRIFGYEIDELFAQPLPVIVDRDSKEELAQVMQDVRDTGNPKRLQLRCRRQDNSTFDAEIAIAHVPNNESHLVCTVFDITQFKSVQRMKDHFVSMVNHELRTPIAGMLLSASTLQSYYDRFSEEQRMRKISQIHQQANLMSELVNSILEISYIEARDVEKCYEDIDMTCILDEVISQLIPIAREKKQTLENATCVNQAVFQGDQTDFARIWRNLVSNATKYTPEHGEITVQTAVMRPDQAEFLPNDLPDTKYVVGIVQDNGPGISPDDQEKLFTRFFRGWAKTSQIPGTGLGLALVRETLNLYGGDIIVDSIIDVGTTFTFWIPISREGNDHDNDSARRR